MTDTTSSLIDKAMAAAAAPAPLHDAPDGSRVLVVPAGYRAERLAPVEPPLPRIVERITMHDCASFTAYVNRFKTAATQVFAEPGFLSGDDGAHVTAVLDYHEPGRPDRGAHAASYRPRYSDAWRRWHTAVKSQMKQSDFAEFIEEHRGDISHPAAAQLLDIVRTFKASRKVEFDSLTYQPNGDVLLSYDDRTQQTGKSGPIPETMTLGIPVYFRGEIYAVPVFVRFKVGNGAVAFQIKLDRSDIIEDAAFTEVARLIGEEIGINVYLGRRS